MDCPHEEEMLNLVFAAIALIFALGASKYAGFAKANKAAYHRYSIMVGLSVAAMVYFLYPVINKHMIDLRWYFW